MIVPTADTYHPPLEWVPRVVGRYGLIQVTFVDKRGEDACVVQLASRHRARVYLGRKGARVLIIEEPDHESDRGPHLSRVR